MPASGRTGNLNIAAVRVLNADNIQVAGTSSGTPTPVVPAAPNISGITQANAATASTASAAEENAKRNQPPPPLEPEDSTITVEVLGYGGGDSSDR